MTCKNYVGFLAIAPRRRGVATALMYGLSLAVRFTSCNRRASGNSAAVHATGRSDNFHDDQGWRRAPLRRVEPELSSADSLSPRLAAAELPRSMRTSDLVSRLRLAGDDTPVPGKIKPEEKITCE